MTPDKYSVPNHDQDVGFCTRQHGLKMIKGVLITVVTVYDYCSHSVISVTTMFPNERLTTDLCTDASDKDYPPNDDDNVRKADPPSGSDVTFLMSKHAFDFSFRLFKQFKHL
jgi:hypothetical protein